MCKTAEELQKAVALVNGLLETLGLELSKEKTHEVDFHKDNFEYLNYVFYHLRNDKTGKEFYRFGPSDSAKKKFKEDLKGRTGKTLSKSFEQWTQELNPVLRGKYNYMLNTAKVWKEVSEVLREKGREMKGIPVKGIYAELDGYVRQRLRVNFANRGKRHSNIAYGKMFTVKYSNRFFLCVIKLVSGDYLLRKIFHPELTVEHYMELRERAKKKKYDPKRSNFFKYAYAK